MKVLDFVVARVALLLPLIIAGTSLVSANESPDGDYAITWNNCDNFVLFPNINFNLDRLDSWSTTVSSEQECQEVATNRSAAGSYTYYSRYTPGQCYLTRMNMNLISNYGWMTSSILASTSYYQSGSKLCEASIPPILDICGNYTKTHEGKYIDDYFRIKLIGHRYLPVAYCHLACSFYSNCESVAVYNNQCHLYSTTIDYLLDHSWMSIFVIDHSSWTTYDRYCGEEPYHPDYSPPTTPTPILCPENLSDLHNWDMCATTGTVDKETCEEALRCCYVVIPGISSLCMRPKET